jgi:hypothetical protein
MLALLCGACACKEHVCVVDNSGAGAMSKLCVNVRNSKHHTNYMPHNKGLVGGQMPQQMPGTPTHQFSWGPKHGLSFPSDAPKLGCMDNLVVGGGPSTQASGPSTKAQPHSELSIALACD